MFVANIKISKSKKLFALCAALSVAAMLCTLVFVRAGAQRDTAACDEVGEYVLAAQTPGQRADFLAQFGLTARSESRDEVTVPSTFNAVYEAYNGLQRQIGLDLSPYKGETAERYTYPLDAASPDSGACAVLLVRDGRVIGGHIYSGAFGSQYRALNDNGHGKTG